MNWQTLKFDWNQARAFLATAEEGSLSAAARALQMAQPTVGRQIAALEDELGVVLFDRIGRSLTLTQSGIEILEHVRAMGNAASLVSLTASGQSQLIAGQVCITATDSMSVFFLPPILRCLRKAAPEIEIEVVSSNSIQDLRRREADIAIRHARPEQPELITRLVRESTAHFYAATSFLERHGRPESLDDLSRFEFIGFEDLDRMIAYLKNFGVNIKRENTKLSTNNGIANWELVKQGLGMSLMIQELGKKTPDVEVLFEKEIAIPVPTWLTTHRELHTSRRIRLVYDFLAEALSAPDPEGPSTTG